MLITNGLVCGSVEDELGHDAVRLARIAKAEAAERREELEAELWELARPDLDALSQLDVEPAVLVRVLAEGRCAVLAHRADAGQRVAELCGEITGPWRHAPRVFRFGKPSRGNPEATIKAAIRHGLLALGVGPRALRERLIALAVSPGTYVPPVVLVDP